MKKCLAFLLIIVLVVPYFTFVNVRAAALPSFPGFELMYYNQYAGLFLNQDNNTVRVFQRANGRHFDTLVMDGQRGNAFIRNVQRSDFELTIFRDTFTGSVLRMDSFSESVQREQVEYTPIEGGVSARFTVGDPDAIHLTMFPRYITRERLDYLVRDHVSERQVEEFPLFYRWSRAEQRYVRFHATTVAATGDPTPVPIPWLREAWNMFYVIGNYTFEELEYDNTYWGYDPFVPAPLVYLEIQYTLCGPDLIVTVPRSGMEYVDGSPFRSIMLHPYFLSGTEDDEGYIFVPDGSGGIIMFNNGMSAHDLNIPVFGHDPLFASFRYREYFMQATLPIFGIVRNDEAVLAIIEEGAPVATIHANVSGRVDEFNRVWASFELLYHENQFLRGRSLASTAGRHFDELYDVDITMRYIFLVGEEANYVGLARAYQNYLRSRGELPNNPPPQNAPFFVDFIASAPRHRVFLGIPYTEQFAMTTTENAQTILQSLTDQGVRNIHAQFTHWANDGMMTQTLDSISTISSVGGNSGMRDLQQFTRNNNIALYPTVHAVSFGAPPGRIGRTTRGMLTRNISNSIAGVQIPQVHDRAMAYMVTLLSPVHWDTYVSRINRNLSNLGFDGVAAVDIGWLLFADYGRNHQMSRMDALSYVDTALTSLGNDLNLMLVSPNAYAFQHANIITDLPFQPGGRRIVDFNIPFVQWVLGNYVQFGLPAYNVDTMAWRGFDEYMLRAVESRSGLQLILTYQSEVEFLPTFTAWGTRYMTNMFFQTEYDTHWTHRIGEYYARFNAFYQRVIGADVVEHTVFERGLHVRMVYSNGVVVYINYCNNPWQIGGRTIAPVSFEVV